MTSEADFAPLDPRGAVLGDEVYTILGEAILDGRLRPGERLRDTELAVRLGVSRTPVREALQRLERSGLVEVAAGRWTRVSAPDDRVLAAAHEFVVYMMGNAARMALGRCSEEKQIELLAGADAMIEASAADDHDGIMRTSAVFFQLLTYATRNVVLQKVLQEAEFAIRRNLHGWSPHIRDVHARTELYREFRQTIVDRDGDRAETILRAQHGLG